MMMTMKGVRLLSCWCCWEAERRPLGGEEEEEEEDGRKKMERKM